MATVFIVQHRVDWEGTVVLGVYGTVDAAQACRSGWHEMYDMPWVEEPEWSVDYGIGVRFSRCLMDRTDLIQEWEIQE